MNPFVELNLALLLFLPWFLILGVLFCVFPRTPRGIARRVYDLVAWRHFRAARTAPTVSLITAALLVPFAISLYLNLTTWSPQTEPDATLPAVSEMVTALADRLASNPNDPAGWRLLGQSYLALGQYESARDALREAWQRTPAPDDDLRIALGEAEALTNRESLAAEGGALFDAALANDPENPKALWYGGLSAIMREQPELARERWSKLLAIGPPEPVAQVLREQLELLGGATAAEPADASTAAVDESAVRLLISRSDRLEAQVANGASLFVFARSPDGGPT
jgi:cytochrome c-type biogenesis protein CcmH